VLETAGRPQKQVVTLTTFDFCPESESAVIADLVGQEFLGYHWLNRVCLCFLCNYRRSTAQDNLQSTYRTQLQVKIILPLITNTSTSTSRSGNSLNFTANYAYLSEE
jgi:hypothetical protein